jgi:hypothetical protein
LKRLFLTLTLALLAAVALPTPLIEEASATDNPTATDVFAGDSYIRATGVAGGQRHFRLSLVDDATTTNGVHRTGWDHAPNAQYTFTWRIWTTGVGAPPALDGDGTDNCRAEIRSEATVIATLFNAATCPTTGTTYTWTPTVAGTFRMYVSAVQTNEIADNFNTATGTGGVNDYGALRVGLDVTFTHGAYPAGTTHAYTVAGETVGLTIGHTALATSQPTTSIVLKAIDSSNAAIKTNAVTLAGTSTATSFPIDDAWPASACSCGFEAQVTATNAFTGSQWTHISTATAPATVVSEFVARHASAYNADARVTATHLLQNDNTFSTPPMSENDADDTRYSSELGYVTTRFTNARGEGLVGSSFRFAHSMRDAGNVDTDLISNLIIGTRGGEAGWGSLILFNEGAPTGTWNKFVDITAPATIDDDDFVIGATKSYSVTIPASDAEGMGDPLKLFISPLEAVPEDTVFFAASEAFLDGTARTMNAADTKLYLYDPSGDLVVNGAATTEQHDGIYVYTYTLNATPEEGHWLAVIETTDPTTMDPVTTSNTFIVGAASDLAASLQEHRDHTLEISMHENNFEGLGFDGFLFAILWLIALWILLRRAKGFAAFTALLGFLNEWLTFMPGSRLGYILLFVLGLWLEAILGDKLWQRWLRTEDKPESEHP